MRLASEKFCEMIDIRQSYGQQYSGILLLSRVAVAILPVIQVLSLFV